MANNSFDKMLAAEFPGLVLTESVARAGGAEDSGSSPRGLIVRGKLEGKEIVLKRREPDSSIGAALALRELLVLEAFMHEPPEFFTPEVLVVDRMWNYSICSFVAGPVLGNNRFFSAQLSPLHLGQMLGLLSKIPLYQRSPKSGVEALMKRYRQRWSEYDSIGTFDRTDAAFLELVFGRVDLRADFQHGDPVAFNWIQSERGLCLLDWELASEYLPLYDQATLWCLSANSVNQQNDIVSWVRATAPSMLVYFWLNTLVVTAREIKVQRLTTSASCRNDSEMPNVLAKMLSRAREELRLVNEMPK